MPAKTFQCFSPWRRLALIGCLIVALSCSHVLAGPNDPITGDAYDSLIASQHLEIQQELATIFPESVGYFVTGPLDPLFDHSEDVNSLYHSLRVICPDLASLGRIVPTLKEDDRFGRIKVHIDKSRGGDESGYRGVTADLRWDGQNWPVQLNTINQTRWLIWAQETMYSAAADDLDEGDLEDYAEDVSDYLYAIDQGDLNAVEPQPEDHDLPSRVGVYEPPPDYVIEGYQNYKDYLHSHAAIATDFAKGILAFIPGDSLERAFIATAPEAAYPNKEAPMLQHEYRKFFQRGGSVRTMQTLTKPGCDTLMAGEYFFAVGLNGQVRFGRELLREDVARIEAETGKKAPRANHAFLFPGEPVLTAGAFVIEHDDNGRPYISHINAQSGHYFYSNVTPTIREDIAVHSNTYVLTLGHLLAALAKMEIPFDSVRISKL
ncbi:MAG: hypothetical protein GF341_08440 [candidate division Zixibacteria bacterium]|nr:hypothetical protein [candidate division Zixibacteria bacterium]